MTQIYGGGDAPSSQPASAGRYPLTLIQPPVSAVMPAAAAAAAVSGQGDGNGQGDGTSHQGRYSMTKTPLSIQRGYRAIHWHTRLYGH